MKFNLFRYWSLKTKVTLSTLVIFLASIWLLTSYASQVLREDIRNLMQDQQFTAVSIIASDIKGELDDRVKFLEKAASRITPGILNNTAATQKFLEDRLSLEMMFNGGVFVTKADGTATGSIPLSAKRAGVNFIERDHIAAALNEGRTTVSKPAMGKMLHVPVVSIGTPIRDAKGKIIGALVGVIDLSRPNFLNKITDNRYGKTGGYILFAPKHKLIVTATDKSRVMQPIPAPGINPLLDRYLNGFEGSGTIVDSRGVEVLSSSKQIPVANWVIVARIPAKEAFAPIRAMQNRMYIAAIILSLLAGILTWWFLKKQLSPVFDTLKTLSSITDSNLSISPLPIVKYDEVGQLISGFNNLIVALSDRKRFLTTIIDSEPECIKMLDADGKLLMMNPAGLKMIEADSFEQVKGQCMCSLVAEPYRDRFIELSKQVFQGNSGKLEFEIIGLKGRRAWLDTHAVPFYNEQGEIISLLGITRDTTEHKQAEAEREEALARVRKLEGIIPICMYCKKIREDDQNSWSQLEQYITNHSEAMFSHGICPHCYEEQMKARKKMK